MTEAANATNERALPASRALIIELGDVAIYVGLFLLIAASTAFEPTTLQPSRLLYTVAISLVLIFAAVAEGLVMLLGSIDLAVGAVITLVNVVVASIVSTNPALGIALAIAVGCGAGVVAGLLVAYVRLPSIVVTLALASVWGGIALYVMPTPGGSVPALLQQLIYGPWPIVIVIVLVAALYWFSRLRLGRFTYAAGADPAAAFRAGIPVERTRVVVFGIAGMLLGIAGILFSALTGGGDPLAANAYTLPAITAAVLGGIAFRGGKGTLWGAIAGAVALTQITHLVFFMGVPAFYQGIVNGALLVLSVGISRATSDRAIVIRVRPMRIAITRA
ncbi:MAG: ABC transporter permease [Candidatus Limnocylindrales bacterium]|jgi:ribose transport system permease protein